MIPIYENFFKKHNTDKPFKDNLVDKQKKTKNEFNYYLMEKIIDQCIIDACKTGNLSLIKTYLKTGIEINQLLIADWSLLLYAASYAQAQVIQYLIYLGGDPNLHCDGYTPLMSLCNSIKGLTTERMQCLKYLIEGKVDVNAVNKYKETAFMYACKIQEIDFVSLLLKHVRDINFADNEKRTALFYAVTNNRYDITKILIENGADINWNNCEGLNVYNIALFKKYEELLPLLNINCDYIKSQLKTNYNASWVDMFLTLKELKNNYIDNDVMNLIYGMRLENYETCFCGINLKKFLRSKEEDLKKLGIDITVHRKMFFKELFIFHKHTWKNNLLNFNKSNFFTEIETLIMLGNINKQLIVISSSLNFSKNYFNYIKKNKESNFTYRDRKKLKFESRNIYNLTLQIISIKNRIQTFTEKMHKQNSNLSLPIFIGHKTNDNKKWLIIAFVTITSFYIFNTKNIVRLLETE